MFCVTLVIKTAYDVDFNIYKIPQIIATERQLMDSSLFWGITTDTYIQDGKDLIRRQF